MKKIDSFHTSVTKRTRMTIQVRFSNSTTTETRKHGVVTKSYRNIEENTIFWAPF